MSPELRNWIRRRNETVTSAADEVLRNNDQLVVPDILANAGGVTVSYFEWVQNKSGYYWTLDQVHSRLRKIMTQQFNAVDSLAEEKQIDLRTAAYALALSRIGEAIESQGTASYFTGHS